MDYLEGRGLTLGNLWPYDLKIKIDWYVGFHAVSRVTAVTIEKKEATFVPS